MNARQAVVAIATAVGCGAAGAQTCGGELSPLARTLQNDRYVVVYDTRPAPIVAGVHFVVDFDVCPKPGAAPPRSARVDATMPEHRHGMNYQPVVTATGPGRYRAEGMMLHMTAAVDAARILALGPWPPAPRLDPSNRASGNAQAIALGARLFDDRRLSGTGAIACSTCHRADLAFTDGRARSHGLATGDRNAPTLVDIAGQRWYGWDGANDNLWAQSLRPILDAQEMGGDLMRLAALVRTDDALRDGYRRAFGKGPGSDDETVAVDAAKALAAYLETLASGRTPFDDFRDALPRGDAAAASRYPAAARRGLAIFVDKGRCSVCHAGPRFSNGEFHDTGVPFFVARGRVDSGRHDGIKRLRASPYTLLVPWSDDPTRATATSTRHVAPAHRNFGEFRVPSLRNVARTPPYMHDGSLATLHDVVRHYSELDPNRLHADGEAILRPLRLADAEVDDLVAFLESLSERDTPPAAR
ncbi:MAG: cytochrome c peroxidase [Casimicrobiaceae bacterium]